MLDHFKENLVSVYTNICRKTLLQAQNWNAKLFNFLSSNLMYHESIFKKKLFSRAYG